MNGIKRSASIPGSSAAAGRVSAAARKPPARRGLALVALAMAGSVSGTAFAAESAAVDYFVASAMVVQTGGGSSFGQANLMTDRTAYASAQDQFIDQVLNGRLPEHSAAGRITNLPSGDPPSWPDFGFLRPMSAR